MNEKEIKEQTRRIKKWCDLLETAETEGYIEYCIDGIRSATRQLQKARKEIDSE